MVLRLFVREVPVGYPNLAASARTDWVYQLTQCLFFRRDYLHALRAVKQHHNTPPASH